MLAGSNTRMCLLKCVLVKINAFTNLLPSDLIIIKTDINKFCKFITIFN